MTWALLLILDALEQLAALAVLLFLVLPFVLVWLLFDPPPWLLEKRRGQDHPTHR